MHKRTDLVYVTDGTLEGIFCCIFESYTRRELPLDIVVEDEPTLFPTRPIETDQHNALRVYHSLARISEEVREWVTTAYLSCNHGREMLLFQFIRLAYQYGARVTSMLTNKIVCDTFKSVRSVRNEAHLMCEFLRFSDYNGSLVAGIEPKCITLPLMQAHFTSRLPEETFLIFDRAHGMALYYRPYDAVIGEIDELVLPSANPTEESFRALWKRYYDAVAIEGRYNPKCRMTHMPKRFWKNMTEMVHERMKGDTLRLLPGAEARGLSIE